MDLPIQPKACKATVPDGYAERPVKNSNGSGASWSTKFPILPSRYVVVIVGTLGTQRLELLATGQPVAMFARLGGGPGGGA